MFVVKDEGGTVKPDGDGGDDTGTKPNPEVAKVARKAAIEKMGIEAQKQALNNAGGGEQQRRDDDDDVEIDLEGVDDKIAKNIRRTLKEAREKDKSIRTNANFGLEQARRAKALEIGLEFGLDKDEIDGIHKALSGANNPDAINLSGREIVIKLREDGSFKPEGKKPDAKKDGTTLPPVDTGRGTGANKIKALEEKLDAIDPSDPKAQEELAKLQAEVEAAQRAWEQRRR